MQLGVVLLDENGNEISALPESSLKRYPATVAVGDIRQAHAFAYASKESDLTINGITKSIYDARIKNGGEN